MTAPEVQLVQAYLHAVRRATLLVPGQVRFVHSSCFELYSAYGGPDVYTVYLPVDMLGLTIGEVYNLRWPANARLAAALDHLCALRATMGDQNALLDALAALSTADRRAAHRALDQIAQAVDKYARNFDRAVARAICAVPRCITALKLAEAAQRSFAAGAEKLVKLVEKTTTAAGAKRAAGDGKRGGPKRRKAGSAQSAAPSASEPRAAVSDLEDVD